MNTRGRIRESVFRTLAGLVGGLGLAVFGYAAWGKFTGGPSIWHGISWTDWGFIAGEAVLVASLGVYAIAGEKPAMKLLRNWFGEVPDQIGSGQEKSLPRDDRIS